MRLVLGSSGNLEIFNGVLRESTTGRNVFIIGNHTTLCGNIKTTWELLQSSVDNIDMTSDISPFLSSLDDG